ncbi:tyrosine-type recombinase/integrase [Bacillus sp. ISL-35]|uniref:tyrosine-type recombinase/integrase n=1 Tax=Bacillus sp. ISL-35 TaxID=2819122 RepID=UPI001BE671C9|nr:tyrosine-type recombinase/integrase [Bacillus sp. ISL-35]MBT2678287.1 tyrosine-type recombinase/integrase [Bacillus sp. ISL-35]MBT2705989.1 tyrosine-type recombinase/integrase [Chryseobacterium sp. ISL-80]
MQTVSPIRSRSQIELMKEYLEAHSTRDYSLFLLGINTGIKLQELLNLRVRDIRDDEGNITEFLSSPQYSNPPIYLNPSIREILSGYLNEDPFIETDYLFKSRKTSAPITRQQAYRIINAAAKEAGVTEPVGMTTLRKTFGYHAYSQGIAISLIQKRLQHSSPSETMHFIGLDQYSVTVNININL